MHLKDFSQEKLVNILFLKKSKKKKMKIKVKIELSYECII
jgi:hypothetical protein